MIISNLVRTSFVFLWTAYAMGLLNATEYTNLDVAKFDKLFKQPVDVLENWGPEVKQSVVSLVVKEITEYLNAAPTVSKRQSRPDNIRAVYNREHNRLLREHEENRQTETRLFGSGNCRGCVLAASVVYVSAIAACQAENMRREIADNFGPGGGQGSMLYMLEYGSCTGRASGIWGGALVACNNL
ncbi:hypothetical protein DDE82_009123 [Stemphylium lycopersici]|nr:hypothetical protein TW65_03246 [Stemphylium lycopersici]RAQ98573.1 hypothetical protein DDE82_009123 [Stemphylium lycopersici]